MAGVCVCVCIYVYVCHGQIAFAGCVRIQSKEKRSSQNQKMHTEFFIYAELNLNSCCPHRDILINLRITTDLAVALGIELHVCELQLVLREFADLKHTTGQ